MSYSREELEKLPWRMVFRFRYAEDLETFLNWVYREFGDFDTDEMVIRQSTKTVTFTLELIEPFAPMVERATMHHHMDSIRLNRYQPKQGKEQEHDESGTQGGVG
jgi:hypothetical protein